MIFKIIDILANFRCPKCNNLLPFIEVRKTSADHKQKMLVDRLDYHSCDNCNSKVKIADSFFWSQIIILFVGFPTFLLSAFAGYQVVLNVSFLSLSATEPNILGLLVIITFFIIPTTVFCCRLFTLKVIKK